MNQIRQARSIVRALPQVVSLVNAFFYFLFDSYVLLSKCLRQPACGLKIEVDKRNQSAQHGAKNKVKIICFDLFFLILDILFKFVYMYRKQIIV